MKRAFALAVLAMLLGVFPSTNRAENTGRKIACKTETNASSCYWTRGRLGYYNGSPAYRLWKVGTHRVLGIYSGPSVDRQSADNEYPEFPTNIKRVFEPTKNRIFADFEVCPLEAEKPGAMQSACIDAAKNVFVEKFE